MLATSVVNVGLNALLAPHAAWALLPVAVFSFGWALMVPAVTLLALDQLHRPARHGFFGAGQRGQPGQCGWWPAWWRRW
jgi:DHA1 family bicyclomycin/chloramphenicol resistance-like MFS transporter